LNGSENHGYVIFASADESSTPCPGWPQRYFTAPAILVLGGLDRFDPALSAIRQRQAQGDYSPVEVELVGRVCRRWLTLIFRMAAGGYSGNGFGESGGKAVLIQVQTIRRVEKPGLQP
jgi:hypothetical protein